MPNKNLKLVYSRSDASLKTAERFGKWFHFFEDGPSEFGKLAFEYGFKAYALVQLPSSTSKTTDPELLQTNIDPNLLQAIEDSGALGYCSIFQVLSLSSAPFGWATGEDTFSGRTESIAQSETDQQFDGMLNKYGIRGGYCVPLHDTDFVRYVVIYLGARCDGAIHYPELVLKSAIIFDGSHKNRKNQIKPDQPALNVLEAKCLNYLSNGLSIPDIGKRLALSQFAVSRALQNCRKKFSAPTDEKAILEAVKVGVLKHKTELIN